MMLAAPAWLAAQTAAKRPDKGPPLAPDMVKTFVGAAHGNLEKTKEMLAETPARTASLHLPGRPSRTTFLQAK